MRLFRIKVYEDVGYPKPFSEYEDEWYFVLAENEKAAKSLELESLGYSGDESECEMQIKVVEYPLDKPMVLPDGYQQINTNEITE